MSTGKTHLPAAPPCSRRGDAAESDAVASGSCASTSGGAGSMGSGRDSVCLSGPHLRPVFGGERGELGVEVVAPPEAHAGLGSLTRSVSQARQSAYRREIASGCAHHRRHQLFSLVGPEARRRSTTWAR